MGEIKFIPKDAKTCSRCKEEKPIDFFGKRKDRPGKYRSECRECYNKDRDVEKYNHRYKDYRRNWHLTKHYNITLEDYNQMFADQEGRCGICGTHQTECKKALAVDHNHETNEVRGLLCDPCNLGLGKLGDNVEGLEQAMRYLNGDTGRSSDRR